MKKVIVVSVAAAVIGGAIGLVWQRKRLINWIENIPEGLYTAEELEDLMASARARVRSAEAYQDDIREVELQDLAHGPVA